MSILSFPKPRARLRPLRDENAMDDLAADRKALRHIGEWSSRLIEILDAEHAALTATARAGLSEGPAKLAAKTEMLCLDAKLALSLIRDAAGHQLRLTKDRERV